MDAAATVAALSAFFRALSGGEVQVFGDHTLYRLAAFGYVVTRVEAEGGTAFVLSDVDGPLVEVGALVVDAQGRLRVAHGEVDEATRAALERFVDEAVRPQLT